MKFLHSQPQTKELLVSKITEWYQTNIDKKEKSTKIINSCIGHISGKQVSVQVQILSVNGETANVYFTPKNWWVKKLSKNNDLYFSKAVLDNFEVYNQ